MTLLVATNTPLKKLCPPEIQDHYFESIQYGVFQVISSAHNSAIAILSSGSSEHQVIDIFEVFDALLMEEL